MRIIAASFLPLSLTGLDNRHPHPKSVTCREGGVGEYPVSRDSLHGNEGVPAEGE